MPNWMIEYNAVLYASLLNDFEASSIKEQAIPLVKESLKNAGYTDNDLYHTERAFYLVQDNPEMFLKPKFDQYFSDLLAALIQCEGNIKTDEYPEFFFRLQMLMFYNEDIGYDYLLEFEELYQIDHTLYSEQDSEGNDLNRGYYHFYFKELKRMPK